MKNQLQPSFVSEKKEQTFLQDGGARKFFNEWCRVHGITTEYVSRQEWTQKKVCQILEDDSPEKRVLCLPEDFNLSDIITIIKGIDSKTFPTNNEKAEARVTNLNELGNTFQKAGRYLLEYLSVCEENEKAKELTEQLAHDFYEYGMAVKEREDQPASINTPLPEEEKNNLDRWFLGEDIYEKRFSRLEASAGGQEKESLRKKLLSIYLTSLSRAQSQETEQDSPERKTGPLGRFQEKTRKNIEKTLEIPSKEIHTAVFENGMEQLATQMKKPYWKSQGKTNPKSEDQTDTREKKTSLWGMLQISKLKEELGLIRQQGNPAEIAEKELEIAKKIQAIIRQYPFAHDYIFGRGEGGYKPAEILSNSFINCLGASLLGGKLLTELGIKYVKVGLPDHSVTFLVTTDGKVRWQDFTPGWKPFNYKEIKDKDITGSKEGEPVGIKDIIRLSQDPSLSGLRCEIKSWWYPLLRKKFSLPNRSAYLGHPQNSLPSSLLNNTSNSLHKNGLHEEALAGYRQAILIDPEYPHPYNGLGNTLRKTENPDEAIEAYKKAIELSPANPIAYIGMGNTFYDLKRYKEAIEAFENFMTLWEKDPNSIPDMDILFIIQRKLRIMKQSLR